MAHVLVIDDNPVQRQLVREVLETRGDVVLEAADGAEGFDTLLHSSLPLVVLFDYQMPAVDGFALLQRVAGDARILERNAFILSTSSGEDQLPALFLQLLTQLAIPILLKPMPLDQLQQAVRVAAARLPPDTDSSAGGTE